MLQGCALADFTCEQINRRRVLSSSALSVVNAAAWNVLVPDTMLQFLKPVFPLASLTDLSEPDTRRVAGHGLGEGRHGSQTTRSVHPDVNKH